MPLSEFPLPAADTAGDEPPEMHVAPPGPMSRSGIARRSQVECPAFGRRRETESPARTTWLSAPRPTRVGVFSSTKRLPRSVGSLV